MPLSDGPFHEKLILKTGGVRLCLPPLAYDFVAMQHFRHQQWSPPWPLPRRQAGGRPLTASPVGRPGLALLYRRGVGTERELTGAGDGSAIGPRDADSVTRHPALAGRKRLGWRSLSDGLSVGHCLGRPRRQRCCRQWRIRQWGGSFVRTGGAGAAQRSFEETAPGDCSAGGKLQRPQLNCRQHKSSCDFSDVKIC